MGDVMREELSDENKLILGYKKYTRGIGALSLKLLALEGFFVFGLMMGLSMR